jgi:uncharacterized protein (DUF362 family)
MHPPSVFLAHCEAYDPDVIESIVAGGLERLGLVPRGRVLVKPNVVISGPLFRHAYTRPEFVQGVIGAIKRRATEGVAELLVGERCGITIPTRYAFRQAGYFPMLRETGARAAFFEETRQVEIPLSHGSRLRDTIYVPQPIARADFFVNCPKFKAHPWTTVTFSMKNYIGIQDDRHRLVDHDYALSRKVADLQHVIQPQFIAIDAIVAGEGRMLTPLPRELNLIVMGNNQVAVDTVCCHIVGVDPREVDHIRLAHEDGFGPIDLERIAISGDVSLDAARERAQGYEVGLVRVEKYFDGCRLSAYAGPAPGGDYCWGGCPGALEEAVEVLRRFDQSFDARMPRMHWVFGKYEGPLDIAYGEKVVFVGDCTEYEGQVGGQLVRVENLYKNRDLVEVESVAHENIYEKMIKVGKRLAQTRSEPTLRLEGCPVSVAELILVLATLAKSKNPYFDPREILGFNRSYLASQAAVALKRLGGEPYQIKGQAERGDAAPHSSASASIHS